MTTPSATSKVQAQSESQSGKRPPRIFSGIQPSGNLTIGNYLGALRQWVSLQQQYDSFYCVVDMHALTTPIDPEVLREGIRRNAGIFLASGLDPKYCTIFIQSHVSAHAELGWILGCLTPIGWLQRMTQFKDKSAKQEQDSIGSGLLTYPVLMTADILLYHTNLVPVGDDQKQHIELARDIALRFNHMYGETFTVPEGFFPKAGARIMGLDTPTAKMSKSEKAEGHAVYILDEPDKIRKKIMKATTDSGREIVFSKDPEKAGVNNLLTIYQAFTGKSEAEVEADFANARGYGDLKKGVAEAVIEGLRPLQEEYHRLTGEGGYIDEVLQRGADRAREVAEPMLRDVMQKVGFVLPKSLPKR
jgi:tryptophanyl-tRNA synthetase